MALILLFLTVLPDLSNAQDERTTLIAASKETPLATLLPMRNGLSALTLVWPLGNQTPQDVAAIQAGLVSVMTGGTDSRTPWQIETFLRQKGVHQQFSTHRDNLLLTISAPHDVFPETLEHLKNALLDAEYSDDWYARELHMFRNPIASVTRRSSDVLIRVEQFLNHGETSREAQSLGPRFRFGRPSHAILRSEDEDVVDRTQRLLKALPTAGSGSSLNSWLDWLTNNDADSFALPRGVIHFADPISSETLLMLVHAKEFESEVQQVGTNLLMDYIGSGVGSEMFRTIRQELRASYDPESRFVVFGKRRAILMMSATVEAEEWPEIYDQLRSIYQNVQQGKVDQEELEIQYGWLKLSYEAKLFRDALWTAEHYLDAYPKGPNRDIQIPLFDAFGDVNFEDVIAQADTLLPPFEEYLLVVIGGGVALSSELRDNAYCALKKFEPVHHCLERLLNTTD